MLQSSPAGTQGRRRPVALWALCPQLPVGVAGGSSKAAPPAPSFSRGLAASCPRRSLSRSHRTQAHKKDGAKFEGRASGFFRWRPAVKPYCLWQSPWKSGYQEVGTKPF